MAVIVEVESKLHVTGESTVPMVLMMYSLLLHVLPSSVVQSAVEKYQQNLKSPLPDSVQCCSKDQPIRNIIT